MTRENLRDEEIWAKLFGAGAHVIRDTFPVVLHGIRTSTIEAHQTNWATISRLLLAENAPLFPNADILHTGWLCSAKAKQKPKTSIVVSFSTPEDGNRAIEQGMIWEGSAHSAELYSPGCQMQQCHKCQHYGHLGNRCHAPIKCAVCQAITSQEAAWLGKMVGSTKVYYATALILHTIQFVRSDKNRSMLLEQTVKVCQFSNN